MATHAIQVDIVASLPPSILMDYWHFGQVCNINPSWPISDHCLRQIQLKLDKYSFATSDGDVQKMRIHTDGIKHHNIYRKSIAGMDQPAVGGDIERS